jgi:GcrA cell cycle regulator
MSALWDDERSALAAKLYREGLSAAQIAKQLGGGLTRNAVIGRLHRMGASNQDRRPDAQRRGGSARAKQMSLADKPRRTAGEGGLTNRLKQMPAKPRGPTPAAPKLRVINVESVPKTLMQLRPRMCRWPIEMDVKTPATAESLFCAARTAEGEPFCRAHRALAWVKPNPKAGTRELIRMARRYA